MIDCTSSQILAMSPHCTKTAKQNPKNMMTSNKILKMNDNYTHWYYLKVQGEYLLLVQL